MSKLFAYISTMFGNSFMIRSIVFRDIKTKYIGSVMGFFWAFIHPLMLTAIYTLIFTVFFQARVERMGADASQTLPSVNFAVWFLAGILAWNLFSETVTLSAQAVVSNASLIKKTLFPSEILPFTTFLSNSVNHIIGLGILVVLMVITQTPFSHLILLLPLFYAVTFLFALGFGWIMSSLNVYVRDVSQLLQVGMQVWFFLTPIFYQASFIGKKYPALSFIYSLNPLYFIVEGYRSCLIGGYNAVHTWQMWYPLYIVFLGVMIFSIGAFIFKKLKWGFADVL